ncbi:MAG: hypothetical protein LBK53_06820 [Heliobacteriaceae bacterium]|jgi:YD repeat-containing protein|nr:hypothetical protein [Heliobacteriaceae bacterium]
MTGEITAQTLTIKKGQGLTYALLDLVKAQKMEISDGKITLAEWNATIDKLAEIQQARRQAGKASIFTGGTDKNDYQTNFVVHPNQQIEFSAEEMDMLYTAMGVSLASGTSTGTQNKRVTEPWDDGGEEITEYDTSGKKIKTILQEADGRINSTYEYEYDTSGNEIKRIDKDGTGKITGIYEMEYDASGHEIKTIYKSGTGKIINIAEMEYDTSGHKIREIGKDASGKIECTYDNEYDASGNQIKRIRKDDTGKITNIYEMEYDASGNLIKRIDKDEDGNIIED